MQLSITTDYGIRILTYIAMTGRLVSSRELSEQLCISQPYVYRVGDMLKKLGLVAAVNGPTGGYQLAKKPQDISLYEVVCGFEGSIKINKCLEKKYCSRNATNFCSIHKFFAMLQNDMEDKLKNKSIAALAGIQ